MPSDAPTPLERLSDLGQSVWVDFLSRESIRGGHLQELIDDYSVVGATSNPTIFEKAMSSGDAYDEQLHELAELPTSSRRSGRWPNRTSETPATCSARCGTAAADATATSRSRSTRAWPTTRCRPSARRCACTRASIART